MDECPPIAELAALAEGEEVSEALRRHAGSCTACKRSLQALEEDVRGLQLSISELWFQERVSCPPEDVLARLRSGSLDPGLRDYVEFHVDDLACPFCQATLGEAEVEADRQAAGSRKRSRSRVGEATSLLLGDLRRKR